MKTLYLSIHVDTHRGTREGIPPLLSLLDQYNAKGTFLFSLGPDNTGRAIKRIFRPGFFKKVQRTSVVSVYGLKTLLYGTILPGPHIGYENKEIIKSVKNHGHEVGIHTYDHIKWQDGVEKMPESNIRVQINKAQKVFENIFGERAKTMGAAGWQANKKTLRAYDDQSFLYASDTRGTTPFYPKIGVKTFKTLQIPTTLPTLDELIGREEYPQDQLVNHYLNLIEKQEYNVLTIHSELEGMYYKEWFEELLQALSDKKIRIAPLEGLANKVLENPESIPVCNLVQDEIDGRSGVLATQG